MAALGEEVPVTHSSAIVTIRAAQVLVVRDADDDLTARPGSGAWHHHLAYPIVSAVLLGSQPARPGLEAVHPAPRCSDHQLGNLVDVQAVVELDAVVTGRHRAESPRKLPVRAGAENREPPKPVSPCGDRDLCLSIALFTLLDISATTLQLPLLLLPYCYDYCYHCHYHYCHYYHCHYDYCYWQ